MGGFFDIDSKKEELSLLEKETHENDFWNSVEKSGLVLKKINLLKQRILDFENLKKENDSNYELYSLAIDENDLDLVKELDSNFEKIKKKLRALNLELKLSGKFDKNNAILTLHSGAGGTEACDWTDMLFRMYSRYAEKKGFSFEVLDILPGEEVGIKSVVALIKGDYAYGYLKAEIGVHRLVRISPFDSNKRRHTSFSSCDVIPEIMDDIDIKIEEKDLRIDTYRASGAGGQHVNRTESAIRITHIPTGIVVQCQNERSQHKNKEIALKLLKAKLYEMEEEKRRQSSEKHYDEKGLIAWGNQIRSYVFCPYTMVKDHRTNFEVGNITAVMDGEIDGFIEAYLSQ